MHPLAWIVWATGAGFVAFTTTNPFYLLVLIAAAWVVHAGHRVDGPTARSFRVFLLAGLIALALRTTLVVFGTVDASSIAYAAFEGARLAAILVVFGTFNSVTDPFGVLRLAPRRFHEPALAAALALAIAPRTVDAVGKVRESQELRGIRVRGLRTVPMLAIPVLATGMEAAVTLAESMDARGHGRGRRSRYRPQRWTFGAAVVALSGASAAAVFLAAAFGGWGDLHPSTAPLVWPDVAPALIAAAAATAIPGLLPRGGER